ncbi:MAG TPA: c-type cytochrome [Vicinamibacteria bacterium]|nr:c-type cytochrome [Vicinamibacteria bacterium]
MKIAGTILLLAVAVPAASQIPDEFTNLKVLPADIAKGALVQTMRGFSFALGVRCEHCHVGAADFSNADFASDDLEPKRVARRMLQMVKAINGEHIAGLGRTETLDVSCFTCHRGVSRPEPIESILSGTIEESGLQAAIAKYREMREDHYGSASYDFHQVPLNRLAEDLMAAGKPAEAAVILELNDEFNPDSGWIHQLQGEAYTAAGEREKAIAALERALAIDPENPRVKAKLEELRKEK